MIVLFDEPDYSITKTHTHTGCMFIILNLKREEKRKIHTHTQEKQIINQTIGIFFWVSDDVVVCNRNRTVK